MEKKWLTGFFGTVKDRRDHPVALSVACNPRNWTPMSTWRSMISKANVHISCFIHCWRGTIAPLTLKCPRFSQPQWNLDTDRRIQYPSNTKWQRNLTLQSDFEKFRQNFNVWNPMIGEFWVTNSDINRAINEAIRDSRFSRLLWASSFNYHELVDSQTRSVINHMEISLSFTRCGVGCTATHLPVSALYRRAGSMFEWVLDRWICLIPIRAEWITPNVSLKDWICDYMSKTEKTVMAIPIGRSLFVKVEM
jgi:hypothetical protein